MSIGCPNSEPQLTGRGDVITIASGKGGVGKTNLALNVGIALARCGQNTILIDANFGLANVDVMLRVAPVADMLDLDNDRRPLRDMLVAGPHGLRVLCGPAGARGSRRGMFADRGAVRAAIERLRRHCDVLLIDCGAGCTETIETFAALSDQLLICTTPEPPALADAYALVKLLKVGEGLPSVGVVVNMASSPQRGRAAFDRLARAAEQFLSVSPSYLGSISHDRHVPMAVEQRAPLLIRYPNAAASRDLEAIAARLRPQAPLGIRRGVWAQLAGLFL